MRRIERGIGLALAVLAGTGVAALGLLPAAAAQPASSLVANPSTVSIDMSAPAGVPVAVNLDPSTCLNALQNGAGQSYSITAVVQDTSVASVSPDQSAALNCSGAKGLPTSAQFTVSVNPLLCNASGLASTSVLFDPVTSPPGQASKLSGVSIPVNVSNVPACVIPPPPPPPPPGNGRPAAPAVAAATLIADNGGALTQACKANVPYKGNGWFGAVISAVAGSMPKPESVKDTDFSTDSDWITYVQTALTAICSGTPPSSAWPPLP